MAWHASILTVVVVVCCAWASAQGPGAGFAWQGFEYEWEYRVAGVFETPHRMGSIASTVSTAGNASGSTSPLTGTVFEQFTPGVDGDFAFPRTFVTAVSGGVWDVAVAIPSWTDKAGGPDDAPVAFSSVSVPVTVPGASALTLNGFQIEMVCNPALQPSGEVCNSNGIWPINFSLGLSDCASTANGTTCMVDLTLDRAWTPAKGGGKPFNWRMTYTPVVRVAAWASGVKESPGRPLVRNATMWSTSVRDPVPVSLGGASGGAYPCAVVGVKQFGFQLHKTADEDRLGRYIKGLGFGVVNGSTVYDPTTGVAKADVVSFVVAPLTTVDAKTTLVLEPVLIQLPRGVCAGAGMAAVGEVCENVRNLFDCAHHGLPDRLNATVPIRASNE